MKDETMESYKHGFNEGFKEGEKSGEKAGYNNAVEEIYNLVGLHQWENDCVNAKELIDLVKQIEALKKV
jgi:flagellar biosynthesis/type III secretory pathway protein FliH